METTLYYEHQLTEMRPSYGGARIISTFSLEHTVNGIKNEYKVEAEILGFKTLDPHYWFVSSECVNDKNEFGEVVTNEETLTSDGVENLFDSLVN